MTSQRPYLLRALYEWIADNDMTPHILVDARRAGVRVPPSTVRDGQLVLNIAERAVMKLQMDNDRITFSARFGGVSQPVLVPMDAVLAIYARETGAGMGLPPEPEMTAEDPAPTPTDAPHKPAPLAAVTQPDEDIPEPPPSPPAGTPRRGAHLKVVK